MRRDSCNYKCLLTGSLRFALSRSEDYLRSGVMVVVIFALMMSFPLSLKFESSAMAAQVGVDSPERKKPPSDKSIVWSSKIKIVKPKAARKPLRAGPSANIIDAGNWARIPAGEFIMGSENGASDEKPVHRVQISRPFEMGKYETTQMQWEAVMGSNPSYFKGASLPVEQVSWDDVQRFIQKLNAQNDGYVYRLPTEAEWEYACRAGSTGDYAGNLDAMAWYNKNSGGKPHPVGQKQPNAWGLYDMHGNVWEWCQDPYDQDYYAQSPGSDPQGPATGLYRVVRECGWNNSAQFCRSASRLRHMPGARFKALGFRLVRTRR